MSQLPRLSPAYPAPLYQQLKDWIIAGIRSGGWPPDTPIPSERTLTRDLQVSRATIRRAIDDLEHQGWVVRRQGRGTFVTPREIESPPARFGSFGDSVQRAGRSFGTKLLSAQLAEPDDPTARALGTGGGQVVAVVTRLHLADDQPLLVERSHLPYRLTPRLLDQDLTGSLDRLLIEHYRLELHGGEEHLQVTRVATWVARALGIKKKRPVLCGERIVRSRDGSAIVFSQRYARADRCTFRATWEGAGTDFEISEG